MMRNHSFLSDLYRAWQDIFDYNSNVTVHHIYSHLEPSDYLSKINMIVDYNANKLTHNPN